MSIDNQPTQDEQLPDGLRDDLRDNEPETLSGPGAAGTAPRLGRRRLLQMLTITGASVAADLLVPAEWIGPQVEVGWLPAHAENSKTPPPPTFTPTATATIEATPTPPDTPAGAWSKERILIPAGPFTRGAPQNSVVKQNYNPEQTITLSAFYIDKYPVTNARYAEAVAAGACPPPDKLTSSLRSTYYEDPAYKDYPVLHVSWGNASKFCQWAGGRLPTEAEWEKAARGTDKRGHPWGSETPLKGTAYCNCGDLIRDTTPVYQYPKGASPYGVMDMVGNVDEWVNDRYDETYYSTSPTVDPPGPTNDAIYYRVTRGGTFFTSPWLTNAVERDYTNGRVSVYCVGFRCAYNATVEAAAAETPRPPETPTP